MIFTRSEASSAWCPFARVPAEEVRTASGYPAPGGPSINRSRTSFPSCTRCLAERCMAWRWATQAIMPQFRVCSEPNATDEPERPKDMPAAWQWRPVDVFEDEPAGWIEPFAEAQERRRGYCGMAGGLRDPSEDIAGIEEAVRELSGVIEHVSTAQNRR